MTDLSVALRDSACDELRSLPRKRASALSLQRGFPLHAMLSSGGHSIETEATYSWNGMQRGTKSFACVELTLDGRGRLDTANRSYVLTPGALMLVHVPSAHRYYLPDDSDHWEFVYLVVYGRELLRILQGIERRQGNVAHLSEDSQIPGVFLSILRRIFSSLPLSPSEISAAVYELAMQILAESQVKRGGEQDPRFEALKNHLAQNLGVQMTVPEMADYVSLSRSHFTRLFKEHVGMSPGRYVESLRVKRALQLLYNRSLTIKEISYACGIGDVNYFCRLFRKEMGVSPGEYRRSGL